ncbi:hypothetical protein [Serratia sp. 2723]|uniref:hypothetical protein n=1 Tax=unclassified Serratia (in: enterobacteria) TaxID=2647522 RepID=UPI003D233C65
MKEYIRAKRFSAVTVGLMACLCGDVYAANDIIGDVKTSDLTITASIDAVCNLSVTAKNITVSGKVLDPTSTVAGGAGTVKVDCGTTEFVGLGIKAKGAAGAYNTSATITGTGSGATGTGKGDLTITLGGANTSAVTPSVTATFTKMQASSVVGPATYTLTASTDSTGITGAGSFIYELGGTAYLK